MGILIESCNEYLYESVVSMIPLYEADGNKDKKSFWQKIKDFFRRIWNWIKDKVRKIFSKKKKDGKEKSKSLKDLLKDSKRPTDPNFKSFIDGIKDGLDQGERLFDYYKDIKKDDDDTREKLNKELTEMISNYGEEVNDTLNFTLNNEQDLEDYDWALDQIDKEIDKVEKSIKVLEDAIGKHIPEANAQLVTKLGDAFTKYLVQLLRSMSTSLIERSIKAAEEYTNGK